MSQQRRRLLEFVIACCDLLVTTFSFYVAFWLRFESGYWAHSGPEIDQYLIILGGILPLWLGLFSFFGLYDFRRRAHLLADGRGLLFSITAGVLFISSFTFFYREVSYSRLTFVLFGVFNFGLLLCERVLVRWLLQQAHRRGYHLRRVLIVGAGELGRRVAQQTKGHPELGHRVIGFCDDQETNGLYKEEYGLEVLGRTTEVREIIEKQRIDKVIVALPGRALRKISRVVQACEQEGVEIDIVPDFFKFIQPRTRVRDFAGVPLVGVRFTPVESWKYRVAKRAFDIAFASAVLILTAPLLALIALLIKLTSPGEVFFSQVRYGTNRRPFRMLKFRTMYPQSQNSSDTTWTKRDDQRVTPLGAFLRRTSLDELPQFFNVLKGDMSVVGPRPERPFFANQFKSEVPRYMVRHQVKTGITGWAQVNGWRGDTPIRNRVEHDLYYIENWSFGFDLKIILLTILHGIRNKNAY